jgi:hypothetical protein
LSLTQCFLWFRSPQDIAAILLHSKPDTAAIHYVQPQDDLGETEEKLAQLLNKPCRALTETLSCV